MVTLFEKYGAGARYVGPRVAAALGVEWMDQAFSSADIESTKYPGGGKASDQGSGLERFLGRFAPGATLLDDASIPLAQAQDWEMVQENTRVVNEAGDRGVVMLGRNGALILGDILTRSMSSSTLRWKSGLPARRGGRDRRGSRHGGSATRIGSGPRCRSGSTSGTPWPSIDMTSWSTPASTRYGCGCHPRRIGPRSSGDSSTA